MTDLGTVISTPTGPSPSSITFVVTKGTVHRGQFVELDYSQGTMIALVSDVYKTNRYFERAESVKEFESNGTKLMEQFPAAEWEYLVGETRPLGVFKDGMVKRPTYPPSPGTKVRLADSKNLETFLNIDKEHGIYLGDIEHHGVPVQLSLSKFLQKHCCILAQSGFGKSHSVAVILEELLDRKKESGRIAIIVLDPHGEYSCFAEPTTDPQYKDYSSKTTLIKARNIKIGVPKLSIGILSNIIPGLSVAQRRDLGTILSNLQNEMKNGLGPFDFKTVKSALINDKEINDKTKKVLLGWIDHLDDLHLFGKFDSPAVSDIVKPGHLTIIDLSDVIDMKKKQIIVSYFAQKLFYGRMKKLIPPFLLVVEEAHQFCLSEDTEIFTPTGWKKYTEIKVGDLAFSYNKNTNKLEPNHIERIIVRKHKGDLIKLANEDSINSLVTNDHRVLCDTRTTGKDKKWKWSTDRFVSAKNLPSGARIPVTATIASNSKCNIDDDLIKILGWIITDGTLHFFNNKKYSCYEIFQSKPKMVKEMKKTIKRRFPGASVHSRKRKGFFNSKPISSQEQFTFYLGKNASEEIRPWLGKKPHQIPRKFLEDASLNQLRVLFDALVQGDGHIQRTKNDLKYVMFYVGHNVNLADDFQDLCARLGFSAIVKKVPQNKQTKVLVSFKRKFAYIRKKTKEYFLGNVWDITIKNGAFMARRDGKFFITGNCPEQAKAEKSITKGIMQTIAREGRKFGASLCLVSQRPIQLDTTTLSQCNNKLILRITNPYDLTHIGKSAEGIDSSSEQMLTSLRVGEALMVGEATGYPVFFKVRKRKSQPSKHEIPMEQAARDFEDNSKQNDADTEQFL